MSYTNLKKISCLLLLTILAGCREKPVNVAEVSEIKINDFKSLATEFKMPSAEYTTAPFFVWDGEITKEEIEKDLISFKNAGSLQVFVHPRPGLITEYLSDEWFDLFKYTVDKGKELGMKVWIYDENSYPSGFAGGHVPAEMPESYNQGQGLKLTRVNILPDTAARYFLCLKESEDGFEDITGSLDQEMGKKGKYLLFSKTFNGRSPWYGGFSYVDLLYPGVTQKFIEVTMKGYEKYVLQDFGTTIPGTFTDEPQISSPGGIRWTPDLFERFSEMWKYDLKTQLPSLFEEVGEWKKVRHNYTQTLLDLFIERWSKPWFTYCSEKGLKFTGHYWEHEWPNSRQGGDNMAMYAWHQLPAVDMLFNRWDDKTPGAQFGNVRSIKELASAANQTGRQRKLSETYGGSGWELNFTDMKRNGDWEYALGVNLMNQHLNYFTMAGARKYDYPPTFDYHEPWWNDYSYINEHFARLSLALSSGSQVNDILVLEPTTTAWLYDSYVKSNKKAVEIGQSFQTFITTLEKAQVEYDLGSENIMRDLGDISNGMLVIGKAAYSRVVIPPMTENLNIETYRLLERFVANGGKLITFSVPDLIDGKPHEGLKEFFRKRADKIKSAEKLTPEIISEFFTETDRRFENNAGGALYHQSRILEDGQLIFLANSSLDAENKGSLFIAGKEAIELNTLTGEISGYPSIEKGEGINISWTLPPAGSLLIFIPKVSTTIPVKAEPDMNLTAIEPAGPVTITRDGDNALMIDFCDLKLGNEAFTDLHTYYAADRVYKKYGFINGNPWNTSVQFRRNIVDRDTFAANTGFTASYKFTINNKFDYSSIRAVVERPWLWTVSVNGIEVKPEEGQWWLDRSFGIFRIGQLIRSGSNTINVTASPMKIHAEIEPVYIIGDFSVVPEEKGWGIAPPVKTLSMGSWKEQGLPFYSWGVTYSREFNVENADGKWLVGLGKWNGTVAELYVNGEMSELMAFPPYKTDVSQFIKPGRNKIEVKVIGSLKNLLGPHHNNPDPGLSSPGSWRNVKVYPSGVDYQMLDYGLFEDFKLYRNN